MKVIHLTLWCGLLWFSCVSSKPENETLMLSDPNGLNDTYGDENDYPTTIGYNEMGFRPMNITEPKPLETDPHEAGGTSTKPPIENTSLEISASTISWLEAIMLHRGTQWMAINIILLVLWCVIAFGSLYRLFGLYFCTRLVYECMYLVSHLLIFLASTFNILLLTHLCFGEQGTFPLFLTLLMTHTPSLCIAIACLVISFRILSLCEIPAYGLRVLETRHVGFGLFATLFFSFVGDVVVGTSYNNGVLLSFRGILATIYIVSMVQFILYQKRIHAHKGFIQNKAEEGLISTEAEEKLAKCLITWTKFIHLACIGGVIMCLLNFILSLFFTVSNITLAMFWLVHIPLQISQILVILELTVGISTTLIDVEPSNLWKLYFCPKICVKFRPLYRQGRFFYGGTNEPSQNDRPCIQLVDDRAVALTEDGVRVLNNPPLMKRIVIGHRPMHTPGPLIRNDEFPHNMAPGSIHYGLPYGTSLDSEEDQPPISPTGKYPVMGCNGRMRQGSFRSLPNGSPRNRMQNFDRNHAQESQLESFLPTSNGNALRPPLDTPTTPNPPEKSTENCVKEIILENANLFRSQSQRCADRRKGPRLRSSIKTSPHPLFLKNSEHYPSQCPKAEDEIILNNSTSAAFPETPTVPDHYSTLPASSYGKNIHTEDPYSLPHSPSDYHNPKQCVAKYWDTSPVVRRASFKPTSIPVECPVAPVLAPKPPVTDSIVESPYNEPLQNNGIETDDQKSIDFYVPPPPPITDSFDASTLPSPKRQSLKRNHSSVGYSATNEKINHESSPGYNPNLKYPWYGTWGGRRSKRRTDPDSVYSQKMPGRSSSKGSLTNLYGRIRPRKNKTSEPEAVELNTPPPTPTRKEPDKIEEEPEEPLPQLEEKIDLAAEILKSSSILADFLASRSKEEVPPPTEALTPQTPEETPVEGT